VGVELCPALLGAECFASSASRAGTVTKANTKAITVHRVLSRKYLDFILIS
jgi:hypothetical protein